MSKPVLLRKRLPGLGLALLGACLAVPAVFDQAAGQTAGGQPGARVEEAARAVVRRSDLALEALNTLEARFVQRVENPVLEKTTVGRGTILYRAPDRYRIAYSDPAGDVVVNDGQYIWIYLPSSQPGQVIRQLPGASGVVNPLTYLRDLRSGYDIRLAGAETISGAATQHLVLTPATGRTSFTRLDVWVDRKTGLLRQVRTERTDGVVTTYTFTSLAPGVAVGPTAISFEVPRGVEVFDQ